MEQNTEKTQYTPPNYSAEWYLGLTREMKLKVFKEALHKFPYLAWHMKNENVRASDDSFINHHLFELMMKVLRGE